MKKIRFINKEIINAFLTKCSGHYIKEVKVSIERERKKQKNNLAFYNGLCSGSNTMTTILVKPCLH